jgi:signal peptidase
MIPELLVYDVIVVKGNIEFEEIEKGDIIVFYAPAKYDRGIERVIVHRVNTILDEDPRIIQTKGDANPRSIAGTDYPITEKEYLGKVEYVVPQIGYITQILQPPINYIIIAIIIGAMIAKQVMNSRKSVTFADKAELSDVTPEKTNDIETKEQTEDNELNKTVDSVDEKKSIDEEKE